MRQRKCDLCEANRQWYQLHHHFHLYHYFCTFPCPVMHFMRTHIEKESANKNKTRNPTDIIISNEISQWFNGKFIKIYELGGMFYKYNQKCFHQSNNFHVNWYASNFASKTTSLIVSNSSTSGCVHTIFTLTCTATAAAVAFNSIGRFSKK